MAARQSDASSEPMKLTNLDGRALARDLLVYADKIISRATGCESGLYKQNKDHLIEAAAFAELITDVLNDEARIMGDLNETGKNK